MLWHQQTHYYCSSVGYLLAGKSEAVPSQFTTGKITARVTYLNVMWLTGIESHVLLMSCSLPDDWSYNRVMLQVMGTAGTVRVQANFFAAHYT